MSELSLEDEAAIARRITELIHALDARRWDAVRVCLAERVETDYTSLFGGEVLTQLGREIVSNWEIMLTPIAATQHLLGPITAAGARPHATAECHVRGYHFQPGAEGGPEWMVAGHYTFGLLRDGERWLIDRMRLDAYYQTGNFQIVSRGGGKTKG